MSEIKSNGFTICFVSLEIYPTTPGGAGILIHHTIQNLLNRGYEVVLIVDISDDEFNRLCSIDRFNYNNEKLFHVYQVKKLCSDFTIPNTSFINSELFRASRLNHSLNKITESHHIDLVEFYDYCGSAYYAVCNSIPIAIRLHNTTELIERKIRAPLDRSRLFQYAAERASLVLCNVVFSPGPEYLIREIKDFYPEIDINKTELSLPVHFPIGKIKYDTIARSVIFFGRLSTFKGFDTFIRSARIALDDDVFRAWIKEFIIIGPEETVATALTHADLMELIPEEYKKYFRFTGRIEHHELLSELEKGAFACFPNRIDSFCYAAHELHTAGVPLVLNDKAAFRDHFEDGKTAVFFDTTAFGLAEKMKALAADNVLREALSESYKDRLDYYLTDHYSHHLSFVKNDQITNHSASPNNLSICILSDGNQTKELITIESLEQVFHEKYIFRENGKNGAIKFSGSKWDVYNLDNLEIDIRLNKVSGVILFVRAGDKVVSEWVENSFTLLSQNEKIGSVGCWLTDRERIFQVPYNLLPETATQALPGLRVLIRSQSNKVFSEYLHGWSKENEASLLLDLRCSGLVNLETPMVGVDISEAVELTNFAEQATLEVDFDRMSKTYLATELIEKKKSDISDFEDGNKNENVIQRSKKDNSIVLINNLGGTEFWLLHLYQNDRKTSENWNSVLLEGNWELKKQKEDPVNGAIQLLEGSVQFYVDTTSRIEVLYGPFCGKIEILFAGKIHLIDLYRTEVTSDFICFSANGEVVEVNNDTRHFMDKKNIRPLLPLHINNTVNLPLNTIILIWNKEDDDLSFLSMNYRENVYFSQEMGFEKYDSPTIIAARLKNICLKLKIKKVFLSTQFPSEALKKFYELMRSERLEIFWLLDGFESRSGEKVYTSTRFAKYTNVISTAVSCPLPITVIGSATGMLSVFEHDEVSTLHLPSILPTFAVQNIPSVVSNVKKIELVVLPTASIEKNIMHMVAAVFLLPQLGAEVEKLFLPANDVHAIKIAKQFCSDINIQTFDNVNNFLGYKSANKMVGLCVYPDEEVPEEFKSAVNLNIPCLLGPVTTFCKNEYLDNSLTVSYWEDSIEIAKSIINLRDNYLQVINEYNEYAQACCLEATEKFTALIERFEESKVDA